MSFMANEIGSQALCECNPTCELRGCARPALWKPLAIHVFESCYRCGTTHHATWRGEQTKYRHRVLGLLSILLVITYLDRICLSVAGPRIQEALHIGPIAWGWVTGVFTMSCAAFEIPSGANYGQTSYPLRIHACGAAQPASDDFLRDEQCLWPPQLIDGSARCARERNQTTKTRISLSKGSAFNSTERYPIRLAE